MGGRPLSIGGTHYYYGLGTRAASALYIDGGGGAKRFTASVGVDDDAAEQGKGERFEMATDRNSNLTVRESI